MIDKIIDIIVDTFIDGARLLPFLLIAFIFIELIEHKLSKKSKQIITKSGRFGPLLGSLLGLFPQCGFSVMATNLYVTRIISLGTLIAIYLSTSDEMLPILISGSASISLIIKILLIKFGIGIFFGFIIDFILRNKKKISNDYSLCDDENCHCKEGILKSSIIHTVKTLLFILLITLILNSLLTFIGNDYLEKLFLKNSIFGPFISSLIGLIPNCGASVMITELYLNNAISFGSLISGVLTGSGISILILFKENNNLKENLAILGLIYFLGVISGVIIELIGMI